MATDSSAGRRTDNESADKIVAIKVYAPVQVRDQLVALANRRSESVSKTALAAIQRFLIVAAAAEREHAIQSDPEYQRLMNQS